MPEEVPERCRCGKLAYPDRRAAEAAAKRLSGQERGKPKRGRAAHRNIRAIGGAPVAAYRCTWKPTGAGGSSGFWHIGHRRQA